MFSRNRDNFKQWWVIITTFTNKVSQNKNRKYFVH